MNRAEELGYDVWSHFVIPPFYPRLDLHQAKKPRIIIGGRGCGKTMLLRYLSHQSAFSSNRPETPSTALTHIGLYWRTDTQFANSMWKRDVPEDTWESAFGHMAAVILSIELLHSLGSVSKALPQIFPDKGDSAIGLERLRAFDPQLPDTITEVKAYLEEQLWAFESWISNVRKAREPRFLPGTKFLLALIEEVQTQVPLLRDTTFYVYLDEYENLRPYQKKILNTWLKHSESPLIFNLAMKRNSFDARETTGPESLSDIHDFRIYDLESFFVDEGAAVFFAEILFLQLSNAGLRNCPVDPRALRDPDAILERQSPDYTQKVLHAVERIFPVLSHRELAHKVFQDSSLQQKLKERIQSALGRRASTIKADTFMKKSLPEASIVVPALLHRRRNTPQEIADQLQLLAAKKENRFTGETGWIHNNFVAGLIQLYEPYNKACPFYAGFRTFLQLARGNIRHFLELCHKSIQRATTEGEFAGNTIAPEVQAEAARQASTAFLKEIQSFGSLGHQLHTFVLRLGSVFALAHLRPTLSESEQSHFSIGKGTKSLTTDDHRFLREAGKWSVLFEEEETKRKEVYRPESVEYILNPIYAPYFHITYRKKRKLSLSTDDVICLIRGSYDEVSTLLKRYSASWNVDGDHMAPSLFSHLAEDE